MKRKWIKEMKRSQILRIVLGGQLLISTLKLFGEGGGREGGTPTLISIQHYKLQIANLNSNE